MRRFKNFFKPAQFELLKCADKLSWLPSQVLTELDALLESFEDQRTSIPESPKPLVTLEKRKKLAGKSIRPWNPQILSTKTTMLRSWTFWEAETFLHVDEVPNYTLSSQTAATKASIWSGQALCGALARNPMKQINALVKKNLLLGNSKCHNSMPCRNK